MWVHPQNSLCKPRSQWAKTKEKAIARHSEPYLTRMTQCQCNNEHITAQMRRPSRQLTWSTTSQNSKTHKVEKSCPARANETAFMRRAHEPEIAPSPGASRVRCGPTHAHKTRRSMREVSTESLAVTTLLTKRHANIGCERYPQTSYVVH